jgi:hypothetical protein
MSDHNKERGRKLAMLGGIGLGMALLARTRMGRRYAMAQMMGGGFRGYGPWGRSGGHRGWSGAPIQPGQLPPFIEATLKAWHDRAHGTVPPAGQGQTSPTQQV